MRVRSVGVDGAGHSAWSEAASVQMPAAPQATAAAAESGSHAAPDQAQEAPRKRRPRKGGGERLLALADPKLSACLANPDVSHLGSKRPALQKCLLHAAGVRFEPAS